MSDYRTKESIIEYWRKVNPMGATGDTADPNFMQSLARGLEVLRAFEGQPSLSMAEAARISGLNRPSTGRCLFTLVRLGYVRERGDRKSTPSELQSLMRSSYAVFCLKQQNTTNNQ